MQQPESTLNCYIHSLQIPRTYNNESFVWHEAMAITFILALSTVVHNAIADR